MENIPNAISNTNSFKLVKEKLDRITILREEVPMLESAMNNEMLTTGEISEELFNKQNDAIKEINDLSLSLLETYNNIKVYEANLAKQKDLLNSNIAEIDKIKKDYVAIISEYLPNGLSTSNCTISVTKSSKIETTEDFDMTEFVKTNPDLVKIEYKLDKTKAKNIFKNHSILPKGIEMQENTSVRFYSKKGDENES